MRLSSMRYKNYTWPHNPETFVVEYRRQMAAHKIPLGGCVLQDLGVNCRILRGEGEFAGPGAYEEFKALAAVFQEPGAGMLTHPVWRTDRAYFVSLSVTEEPRPDYVRYSFAFWEDDSGYDGGLTENNAGRTWPGSGLAASEETHGAGVHREAGGYPVGHCPALWRDLEQPDRCQSTDQKSQSHLSGE